MAFTSGSSQLKLVLLTMVGMVASGAAFGLLLFSASNCGCDSIGCDDNLSIRIEGDEPLPPGQYRVALELDGTSWSCEIDTTVAPVEERDCTSTAPDDKRAVSILSPSSLDGVILILVLFTPVVVSVAVDQDGTEVANVAEQMMSYQRSKIENACGDGCLTAGLDVLVPGG